MDKPEEYEDLNQAGEKTRIPQNVSGDTVILDMAMRKEAYAIRFYQALFDFVERGDSRKLLKHLIEAENNHYHLLKEVMLSGQYEKIGGYMEESSLEITDYLIKEEIRKSSGPKDVVKLAIRREEEAEEFYLSRMQYIQDDKLKDLYQRLAKEEGNHRQTLLSGYDNLVLMNIT